MIGLCRIDSENFKYLKFLNMRLNLSTFSLHRNAASPDEIQSCRLLSHQSSTITTRLPPWVISFLTRHFTMDNTLADDVRFLDFFFSAKRTASTEDCSTNAAHRPTYTTNEPINARLTKSGTDAYSIYRCKQWANVQRHNQLHYLCELAAYISITKPANKRTCRQAAAASREAYEKLWTSSRDHRHLICEHGVATYHWACLRTAYRVTA